MKKEAFMKEIYDNLGIELSNEKYNFLGLLHIADSFKNERQCYLHYLNKLHEECLKLNSEHIPETLRNTIDEVNQILNSDTNIIGANSFDNRN